ncbi:hypothetical protein MGMO_122c00050 [Methyloglobulus morosus KoM1]|uniref:Uncharacterized protein n=1 Tax=Methyloglobulus morosus KoM1 TaxID=1116472 RepID=V5BAY7_9GAMM|nr:hypothetical protein [Methyloglobulus morosus]ESS70445.1 hypothetical protein MGMO_122c00050 [Methyloglobulus morosus KoM1]
MARDKVARVCWNTNYWQKPSGMDGKVSNKNSGAYESKTGYGHEEWLLDTNKLVDGFHYAYIQAIGQHKSKYIGDTYNISIYSINSKTKERWWLGEIKNVAVVDDKESKQIFKEYANRGWLKEMYAQLEDVGADVNEFKSISPKGFCCIKYMAEDLNILDEPRRFDKNDPAIKSDYYNLKNKVENPKLENQEFHFNPGHCMGKEKTTSSYKGKNSDIDLLHNQIQTDLYKLLVSKYGHNGVGTEQETGLGTKIDIVVKEQNGHIFYEIKTANTIKQCIRDALAQLLEYAHYPNKSRANKLIVVSPNKVTKESILYLQYLRQNFNIPIYYQVFDSNLKTLSNEY